MTKTATKLQRICAWCKKDMDTGEQLTDAEYKKLSKNATHGICPKCFEKEPTKPPPGASEFTQNNNVEAVGCASGGGSHKGKQLELFNSTEELCFCFTCFRSFAKRSMGVDGRYCKECEELLRNEWHLLRERSTRIRPGWVPKINGEQPRTRKHTNGNGEHKELPTKKIKKLAASGMSCKRIAAELIKEGYSVNYMSIAKLVKKEGGSHATTRAKPKANSLSTSGAKKPRRLSKRR